MVISRREHYTMSQGAPSAVNLWAVPGLKDWLAIGLMGAQQTARDCYLDGAPWS